jgi:acyl-CoA thioesterase YciA
MNLIEIKDRSNCEFLGRRVCFKSDIGVNGNLFGGKLLSAIDEVSAAWACELIESSNVVTIKLYDTVFLKPVKEGNIVHFWGCINEVGNSSLTLDISIHTLDVNSRKTQIVCTTSIKFVKINKISGKSENISDIVKLKLNQRLENL